jgi:GTP-binding protein EngB required for normal cell division
MTAVARQRKRFPAQLPGVLARAGAALATSISADSPLTARMKGLHDRLLDERLQLAVLGQFKRGKSTFLNALLGAPLLPTAVIPITAVATFISWGPQPLVRISFHGQRAVEEFSSTEPSAIRLYLFRFVAEEANPHNRLGVARVELFYPAPILATGTVLIDTPGIGSTLKHNTDAALEILSECDAALFVVSADPPITEVELRYLETLKGKVSRLFFVLNKVDYLQPDERQSIVEFLHKALRDSALFDATAPIFCVSALRGLTAKQANDGAELEVSGIAALENHVVRYLATEKVASLEDAARGKAAEILGQAAAELKLRTEALRMPLGQLTAKSRTLEETLRSIEHQRMTVRDLLAGDKRRLREKLDARTEALWAQARENLAAAIDGSLADAMPGTWEAAARRAVAAAMERIFEAACGELSRAFATETNAVLSANRDRIEGLIETVRRAATELFQVSFPQQVEHEAFKLGEDPYWVTEHMATTLIPELGWVIDRFVPLRVRRRRLRARIVGNTDQLVLRNVANLRWAIQRGLDETFRAVSWQLEERLDDAIKVTSGIITDALHLRQDRSFAVRPEIERLASAERSLAELLADLSDPRVEPTIAARQPLPREARSD